MRRFVVVLSLALLSSAQLARAWYTCPQHPAVCSGVVDDTHPPCYAVQWIDYIDGDSEAGYCVFQPTAPGVQQQYPTQNPWFSATVTHLANGHWDLQLTNLRSVKVGAVKFPFLVDETGAIGSCAATDPAVLDFKLGATQMDDIVLEPAILGLAVKQTTRPWWGWGGYSYGGRRAFAWNNGGEGPPGALINPAGGFSPLLIRTDPQRAELLAATNWDTTVNPNIVPQNAWPMWACNGWFLWYPLVEIDTSQTSHFRFMLTSSTGLPGVEPWAAVALDYQAWFRPLYNAWRGTLDYPQWMKDTHGFLNMALMNYMDGQLGKQVAEWRWRPFHEALTWAQFWGQMSDYAGPTSLGGCSNGSNVGPITACGCCGQCRRLHQRYDVVDDLSCPGFNLVDFINDEVIPDGGHAGFYTAPRCDGQTGPDACSLEVAGAAVADRGDCTDPTLPCPTTTKSGSLAPLAWLQDWGAESENWGANAVYYDTLGGTYYGSPLFTADLFKNQDLSMDSLIEWIVDTEPAAALTGGSLLLPDGSIPVSTKLESIWSGAADYVAFPAVGSLILNDRMFFNGYSDGGPILWGICNNYVAERGTFLLGQKFDVGTPFEQVAGLGSVCASELDDTARAEIKTHCNGGWAVGGSGDPIVWVDEANGIPCWDLALKLAIQERDEHNWRTRPMRYEHRKGLTAVAQGVDIRRFSDGTTPVLAVDNWNGSTGRYCFNNVVHAVPSAKLAILEGADLADSDGDHIGDDLEGQIVATGDSDADGLFASCDNCPNIANANQIDADGDGYGDVCDPCPFDAQNDQDYDGICAGDAFNSPKVGKNDNCPTVANATQTNSDTDTLGDACDSCALDALNDQDNDGICAGNAFSAPKVGKNDNCVSVANTNQADCDADLEGDACEATQFVTLLSEAANDGYVVLPPAAFTNPIYTGDVPSLGLPSKTHRGIVSFNTTGLATDQIRSATLEVRRNSVVGNPTAMGPVLLDVKAGTFGAAGLETGDYSAAATGTMNGTMAIPATNGTWSSASFWGSELPWVNTATRVQFRMRLAIETDNDGAIDRVNWYAAESSGSEPKLTVGYISCN